MKSLYVLDKAGITAFMKDLDGVLKKTEDLWNVLQVKFHTWTQLTFRMAGARAGHHAWRNLSPSTLQTRAGTYRIRRGSDGTPKPWSREQVSDAISKRIKSQGRFTPGPLRMGVRRFGPDSKPLMASGFFRNSFLTISKTKEKLVFGTNFDSKLAKEIINDRPVLFITEQDIREVRNNVIIWLRRGLAS